MFKELPSVTAATSECAKATAVLKIDRVSATYLGAPMLADVSLTVVPGEIVALLGPNGAGKRTLLKAVMGLADLLSGTILLDDQDISEWPIHERARAGLGYVVEGGSVFPGLTVRQNMENAADDLSTCAAQSVLDELLRLYPQFDRCADQLASSLSDADRQNLAIALALLPRPKTLMLDGPAADLNNEQAREILKQTRDVCKTLDLAVLIVDEHRESLLQVADRAVVLSGGAVVAQTNSPVEWLDPTAFKKLNLEDLGNH